LCLEKGVSIASGPSRRSTGRSKRPYRPLDDYRQHLRDTRRAVNDHQSFLISQLHFKHVMRKLRLADEPSMLVRWRKLALGFLGDFLVAVVMQFLYVLMIAVSIMVGWALVALVVWFLILN